MRYDCTAKVYGTTSGVCKETSVGWCVKWFTRQAFPDCCECYTPPMYAQKLVVELVIGNERKPCPLEWLDSFCMRNFTNSADFDDTLPTGEGQLEASFRVKPEQLGAALAAWLNQRGKGNGQPVQVEIRKV